MGSCGVVVVVTWNSKHPVMNIILKILLVLSLSSVFVEAKNQCRVNSDCKRGVRQCVQRKGGISCLWGKCKTYNICAECITDGDCLKMGLNDCIKNRCFLRDYFRDPITGYPLQPISVPPVYPTVRYVPLNYAYHV